MKLRDTTRKIISHLEEKYVAFKQIAPEQNIGFDLSAEYEAALKLFGKKGN